LRALLKFQGLKTLIDGGIGGRTALLREHYEDDPEDTVVLTTYLGGKVVYEA
jgi:predicted amidohydrolase YtcJ